MADAFMTILSGTPSAGDNGGDNYSPFISSSVGHGSIW